MRQLKPSVKSILGLLFFSFLVGSALSIFTGIIMGLIYPSVVNEHWIVWWVVWMLGVAILAVVIKKHEKQN